MVIMVSIAFPLIIGVLLLTVVLFTFYIFPVLICGSTVKNRTSGISNNSIQNPNFRDPISGICSTLINKQKWERIIIILLEMKWTSSNVIYSSINYITKQPNTSTFGGQNHTQQLFLSPSLHSNIYSQGGVVLIER